MLGVTTQSEPQNIWMNKKHMVRNFCQEYIVSKI